LNDISLKKEIYLFIIGKHKDGAGYNYPASKIAKLTGVSRQYVHKLINEFKGHGLIECDNPKDYVKIYSATYKSFESVYRRMSTNVSRRMSTKSEGSSEFIQQEKQKVTNRGKCAQTEIAVQKARYEIIIEREHSDFFVDKKNWMHGNCKHFKHKTKIFDGLDEFQFEKVGKNKLIVIVPGMIFKKGELSIAKHTMFSIAYESLKWFAKEAKIKFKWDTMHLCQKPHITRPAKDSRVIRVAKDWSLSIDGKMLDMSSGKADWETTVFDDSVVDVVTALESWDSFAVVKSELEGFNGRISEIEEVQPKINEKIDSLIEGMNELKKMVQPPGKKLDLDDPAFG